MVKSSKMSSQKMKTSQDSPSKLNLCFKLQQPTQLKTYVTNFNSQNLFITLLHIHDNI